MAAGEGTRLAAMLAAGRRRLFVGRVAEQDTFRQALRRDGAVLFVHGPGGVGKTTLLDVCADIAASEGRPIRRLDGRDVEPSPPGVLAALGDEVVPGTVALIDTYERLAPLDEWVRSSLLPRLPASATVVLAGREPPAPDWRAAWSGLVEVVPLRNLEPELSRRYLSARGVDEAAHDRVVAITGGHPLGLALLADVVRQGGAAALDPLAPDVVGTLLKHFVDVVPSAPHRRALEVCALARVTTESSLRAALGIDDAHELFHWLRGLSFVESGPHGLHPHDLAREVLATDLHWRDPEAYQRIFRGIRTHILDRLRTTRGKEQQRVLFDAKFLHRHQPVSRMWFDWDTFGTHYVEPARPQDRDAILTAIERWESQAGVAARWWDRQPDAFHVVRHHDGTVRGCLVVIDLTTASAEDVAADPAAAAALEHARPAPGEVVTQLRFVVDRDAHQDPSPTMNVAAVLCIQHWLTTPRPAVSYLTIWQPERMAEFFTHFEIPPAGVELTMSGHRYGLFVRDFRTLPVDDWLVVMFERDLTGEIGAVSSRQEFDRAVRTALRDLRRPRAGALRDAVLAAVDRLRADPRDLKLHRVLDRTYLRPAGSQEAAAEVLGLPLSTYKRHLKRAVERIADDLWERRDELEVSLERSGE